MSSEEDVEKVETDKVETGETEAVEEDTQDTQDTQPTEPTEPTDTQPTTEDQTTNEKQITEKEMDEQFYHLAIRVFLLSFSLLSSVYMKLVVKNYLCKPLHSTANISHNQNSSINIMLVNTVVNSYFYYI